MQAHLFAHAADLAFFAFGEDEAQLLGVHPVHLCGFQRLVVQAQAVAQQGQLVGRKGGLHVLRDDASALRAVGRVVHAHQVLLFNAAVFTNEGAGHAAVLREHEQAHGVDVEPAAGRQAAGVLGGEAAAVGGVAGIAAPLTGRANEGGGGFVAVFGLTAHVAHGLVQQDGDLPGLLVAGLGQHVDLGVGRHGHTHDGGFAVDQHPAAGNPFVGLAARAQAEVGHAFVQADFTAHVAHTGKVGPVRLHRTRCVGRATRSAVAVGCVARIARVAIGVAAAGAVTLAGVGAFAPAALVTARASRRAPIGIGLLGSAAWVLPHVWAGALATIVALFPAALAPVGRGRTARAAGSLGRCTGGLGRGRGHAFGAGRARWAHGRAARGIGVTGRLGGSARVELEGAGRFVGRHGGDHPR